MDVNVKCPAKAASFQFLDGRFSGLLNVVNADSYHAVTDVVALKRD